MIPLTDFLTSLSNQGLKNLAVTNDKTYTIKPKHLPGVIVNVNSGLLDLHTKFLLRTKEVLILTTPHISEYKLTKEYAKSNPTRVIFKYIDDTNTDPFENELIKIIKVADESGRDLDINQADKTNSVYTTAFNAIQIIRNKNNERYSVIYQATHKPIVVPGDDDEQMIDLHPALHEALRLYVTAKELSSTNDAEQGNKAIQLTNMYNSLLQDLQVSGKLDADIEKDSTKFGDRGYV